MVGPAIGPFDDGIGGSLQLVMQATRYQTTKDWIAGIVAMERKAGNIRLAPGCGHGTVHRLDDVAAYLEVAKRLFNARLQGEAGRGYPFGKPEALKFGGPAEHKATELGIPVRRARTQIGNASTFVGDITQGTVKSGPALGFDLPLQGGLDRLLAAGSEFQGDALFSAGTKSPADIVTADDEVLAVIGASADQDMDMRIVGVPVVDRHPVEFGSEVALGIGHQFTGEGAEVSHLGRILRRNDEAEMVAVLFASLREGALIGRLGPRVEHTGLCAIAGDAVPLQVGDVLCKRRRAELVAAMPDHARLDHHPACRRAERQSQRRGPASAKTGAATSICPTKTVSRISRLPRGPHHLANEGLGSCCSAPPVADATWPKS